MVVLTKRKSVLITVLIGLLGIGLDQGTKALANRYLTPGAPVPLLSDVFQLVLIFNPGAAFSTGTSMTILFSCLALAVLIGLSVWVIPKVTSRIWAITVGLALAGIGGNFIDRLVRAPGVMRGHVVDFLSLKYFAVFNLADMMLTAAAILVIVCSLILKVNLDGGTFSDQATVEEDRSEKD